MVCAGIGLGLGFGLQSKNDDSSNKDSNQAVNNSDNEDIEGEESLDDDDVSGNGGWTTTEAPPGNDDIGGEEEVVVDNTDDTVEQPPEDVIVSFICLFSYSLFFTQFLYNPYYQHFTQQKQYDAVIVGAGWAGLRAASTLIDSSISNILVLESADYIGGRSHSVNSVDGSSNNVQFIGDTSNIPTELGSSWLYNTNNNMENVLLEDADINFLLDADESKDSMCPMNQATYYQQLREIGDDDEAEETITTEILEDADEWFDEMWADNRGFLTFRSNRITDDAYDTYETTLHGLSYEEAIDQYLERWGWTDDEYLQFMNLLEDSTEVQSGGTSSQIDVEDVEFFPSPDDEIKSHYMGMPGIGFGNAAAKYAEPFVDKIQLKSRVTEIKSDFEEYSLVTYTDEDGIETSVKAKTVLVTVSLGVLKAGSINFVPALPAKKQEAIDNMGFGLVNKCIMTWDNEEDMVWPEDDMWFLLVTPDDETSGQWTRFYNPSMFKGVPTLIGWIGGDDAVEAEKQSTDEVVNDVMKNLRSMWPTISDPDNAIITRWGLNENTKGSYSYPEQGRDIFTDAAALQQRLGRIYFAGEATGSGWGTVIGAWNTGQVAAEGMVQALTSAE